MTKNWHRIGTILLFPRKSPYVKMDMLKSVPKTEKTKNAPYKEVHFYVCRTERGSGKAMADVRYKYNRKCQYWEKTKP